MLYIPEVNQILCDKLRYLCILTLEYIEKESDFSSHLNKSGSNNKSVHYQDSVDTLD